jgi:AsmA protein
MKRLVILLLIVAGVIGVAIASAPFIAATDLAKRRIAAQIEEWTGRPVTFTGKPRVKLFPFLSLTIDNATISDAKGGSEEPLVEMEHLTCKLRLLPFLTGRIEVAEFQLVRPRVRLTVDGNGQANWLARPDEPADATSRPPVGDTQRQLADIRGRIKMFDGILSYDDKRSGRHEELGAVALSLVWPSIGAAVSGTGSFSWRGETVEFNVSVSEPLRLIDGDASPARFAVASKPLRLSFTGTAKGLAAPQLEGATTVTAPSVRRVADWLGTPLGNGPILGAGLIEGRLNWIGRSLSFTDARVELDGNSAEGAIAVDVAGGRPKLTGTLASEKLDLTAYIETFQATIGTEGPWPLAAIRMPLIGAADADIRLSAGQILLGAIRIGKAAVAAEVSGGRLGVDIGEAQFYGGVLTGRGEAALENGVMTASAAVKIDGTPAGAVLRDIAGLSLLDGAVAATVDATARGETWGEFVESLAGTADVKVADGTLSGFELNQIATLAGNRGVADAAAGSGTVPFTSLTGALKLKDGTIRGNDIRVEGDGFAIDLTGGLTLADASVRAKGVLAAARAGADPAGRSEIPFVIGGSWSDPLVLPDYERLIERGAEAPSPPPTNSAARPAQPPG